jgi:hypothetical protein
MIYETEMKPGTAMNRSKRCRMVGYFVAASWRKLATLLAAVMLFAAAGGGHAFAAEVKQRMFASPEEAAKELIATMRSGDKNALLAVLGADAEPLLDSGDAVADQQVRQRFVESYEEGSKLEKSGDAKLILSIGKDNWPFPIPIVKSGAGWRFDTAAGKEEILNRRIGRNELSTVQAVLAYVDAQREYYLANPRKDKLLQYAQRFTSTKDKRDGLYYRTTAGERASPLGPLFDSARAEGYGKGEKGKPAPYHGYYYRIVKGQGPAAPGGAYDYVVRGKMIGGFALVAYPASYGNSGVMTFIVNQDGVVYEKDLGPQSATVARSMKRFDPDKTWKRF